METEAMTRKSEKKTILIIEDDLDIQNFISRVLELEGYQVLRAINGRAGMDLFRDNQVSLVLLDLRLPGPDGWSILQEIKNNPKISHVPVVVLTAIAESVQRRKTLRMGANRYLIKPLSAHNLSKTVADILHQEGDTAARLQTSGRYLAR
jgi:DNA-binding response OmpR family regulator